MLGDQPPGAGPGCGPRLEIGEADVGRQVLLTGPCEKLGTLDELVVKVAAEGAERAAVEERGGIGRAVVDGEHAAGFPQREVLLKPRAVALVNLDDLRRRPRMSRERGGRQSGVARREGPPFLRVWEDPAFAPFVSGEAEPPHGKGVDELVRENAGAPFARGERLRQRGVPGGGPTQPPALELAQRFGALDEVEAHAPTPPPGEKVPKFRGERPIARAQLDQVAGAGGGERLDRPRGERPRQGRGELRRGGEIAAVPDAADLPGVLAALGVEQGGGHELVPAQRAVVGPWKRRHACGMRQFSVRSGRKEKMKEPAEA